MRSPPPTVVALLGAVKAVRAAAGRAAGVVQGVLELGSRAAQLVTRIGALLDRADSLLDSAEATVERATAAVDSVEETVATVARTAARADEFAGAVGALAARLQPTARTATPLVARLVEGLDPAEVDAAAALVDRIPEALTQVRQDAVPMLERLDEVGPELREVREAVEELRGALGGGAGAAFLRRLGERRYTGG